MNDINIQKNSLLYAFRRADQHLVGGWNILCSVHFMSAPERAAFYEKAILARQNVLKHTRERPESVFSKVKTVQKIQTFMDFCGRQLQPLKKAAVGASTKVIYPSLFVFLVSPVFLAFLFGFSMFNAFSFLAVTLSFLLPLSTRSSAVLKTDDHALFLGWVSRTLQHYPELKKEVQDIPYLLELMEHNLIEGGYAKELISHMKSLSAAENLGETTRCQSLDLVRVVGDADSASHVSVQSDLIIPERNERGEQPHHDRSWRV